MQQRLIVPIDGSDASWTGFDVAVPLARRIGCDVHVVTVESSADDVEAAGASLADGIAARVTDDVTVTSDAILSDRTVAEELEQLVEANEGSTVVMASHGRGRSAALVGSVAEETLRRTFGPIIVVGPEASASNDGGPFVVTVDGSDESESALPLAGAWSIELGVQPWVVHVSAPEAQPAGAPDLASTAYVSRLAHDLEILSGHDVQFEELHGSHPAPAVADFVDQIGASMIIASSHGRSGLSRLTMGSVTSAFVHRATCPVMIVRLPHPRSDDSEQWAQ